MRKAYFVTSNDSPISLKTPSNFLLKDLSLTQNVQNEVVSRACPMRDSLDVSIRPGALCIRIDRSG